MLHLTQDAINLNDALWGVMPGQAGPGQAGSPRAQSGGTQ